MKFEIDKIYFGVAVQMQDMRYQTYATSGDAMRIWYEDGFFYVNDFKNEIICIVAPNVRQFTRKKNESTRTENPAKLRSVKLDE
jgi:hypothetical protein